MRRYLIVRTRRDNRLDVSLDEHRAHLIAVVTAIRNQSPGLAAPGSTASDAAISQRHLQELYFRGGSLLHAYSERSTRAIGQYHELCSLASFSLPDQRAPSFAVMNIPSMKHSSHRTFLRSSNWSRKARHILGSTSDSAHCFKRRLTVLLEPYRSGNSPHGAPVQRIQRMPSKLGKLSKYHYLSTGFGMTSSDVGQHLEVNGPWDYKLSAIYYTAEVTAAVKELEKQRLLKAA
jgi:hypothetical protein